MVERDLLVLIVQLWVNENTVAEFEEYEKAASIVMKTYGGKVERVIRRLPTSPSEEPFETHVVSFPNTEQFEAYRQDPVMVDLIPTRDRLILRTVVHRGSGRKPPSCTLSDDRCAPCRRGISAHAVPA